MKIKVLDKQPHRLRMQIGTARKNQDGSIRFWKVLVINQPNIFERKSGESPLEDLFFAS